MATASLVLGIISLLISLGFGAAGMGWIGSICGIVGIVLGALGRKDPEKRGMATAGLVMSIIALSWGVIATIACVACFAGLASVVR